MTKIGILHPGEMGVSIAASARNSGNMIYWASTGRSYETHQRAEAQSLVDIDNMETMSRTCEVILCVCPPHAAEAVARRVLSHGFHGMYLDGNAISPSRAERIAAACVDHGVQYVDGSIIGGPAWQPGRTVLYLSGENAEQAAMLFKNGPLATIVLEGPLPSASALKMCYAAYTKGSTALLCGAMAAAKSLGVLEALQEQWAREGSGLDESAPRRATGVSAKAWRFSGEMDEIAETYAITGIPDGFHRSAAEIYRRIAKLEVDTDQVTLEMVLSALLNQEMA